MASRLGATVAAALAAALLPLTPATPAAAASPLDGFDPGMIISDASFYDPSTMAADDIQSFLDLKGANCVPNPANGTPCLKDYVADTPATVADSYCAAMPAVSGNTAAGIIAQVAEACGINPQVTLVTLQKEQALVTASGSSLTTTRYQKATGAGCPDYAACLPENLGFFQQVYSMARLFKKYRANAANYRYQAGKTVAIQYHPETTCGSASVAIRNQATAGLYIYTPYVPNAAAIANPSGEGDLCSAYGNRNFYRLMRAWFPSAVTSSTAAPIQPSPPSTITPALTGTLAEAARVGGSATLGYESGPVTCTGSTTTGPCTKSYRYGTVTWTSGGAYTELNKALPDATWARWGGEDRYATAALVAQNAFGAANVTTVYVASGENFPDALAGGAAAHRAGAPLLLVEPDAVPPATATALGRLSGLTRIVVLGGEGAVNEPALAGLRAAAPRASVTQLAGDDRFATAVEIAKASWPAGSANVLIASGTNFPDALSLSNLYADHPGPVLLTDDAGLGTAALAQIRTLKASRAYIAGGTGAVPAIVDQQLAAAGVSVTRLGGPDRYATNRLVAQVDHSASGRVFIAAGEAFPDGLAIGAPAAMRQAPLVLAAPGCLPATSATYLRTLAPTQITLIGGSGAVADSVKRLRLC